MRVMTSRAIAVAAAAAIALTAAEPARQCRRRHTTIGNNDAAAAAAVIGVFGTDGRASSRRASTAGRTTTMAWCIIAAMAMAHRHHREHRHRGAVATVTGNARRDAVQWTGVGAMLRQRGAGLLRALRRR